MWLANMEYKKRPFCVAGLTFWGKTLRSRIVWSKCLRESGGKVFSKDRGFAAHQGPDEATQARSQTRAMVHGQYLHELLDHP